LKKLTKTYTPKTKEHDEFYNKFVKENNPLFQMKTTREMFITIVCLFVIRYTFTMGFTSTLKELHDLASQHELIAETIREQSIKPIQITIRQCREQRKKSLDEYNRLKRQLDKQHELLMKVGTNKFNDVRD
jgi:Tfp pilus assembly protein PilO